MALRCTPCKTEKERVYSDMKQKNIFCESGNKMEKGFSRLKLAILISVCQWAKTERVVRRTPTPSQEAQDQPQSRLGRDET
jgi:hypothetical protein